MPPPVAVIVANLCTSALIDAMVISTPAFRVLGPVQNFLFLSSNTCSTEEIPFPP
jgi:hypothetical protein